MHEARSLVTDLALVLGVAALTSVAFRLLRQPVVLGYLLAGLIVGPHVPIPLFVDESRIQSLSELGVILVMFSVGLRFSVRELLRVLPTAGLTGAIQIGAMLWFGYSAGQALGWTQLESVFAGAIVAISSTMIVSATFAERGIRGPAADLAFAVLVVQDLAAVLLLAVLTGLASSASLPEGELVRTLGRLAAFLVALCVAGFLVVPRAMRAIARLRGPETLLVASVGLCFSLALLADAAGYSVALGAFLAGSLVAESGEGDQIQRLVAPLRDVFAAVFFVAVGMSVEPAAVIVHWQAVLALTLVVIVGQSFATTLGALLAGNGVRTSVQTAMSLTQIGEFAFIIAGLGVTTGAVRPFLYAAAVATSAITTFTSPWLIAHSPRIAAGLDARLPHRVQTFLSLYGSWREDLRQPGAAEARRGASWRLGGWLAADALVIGGVIAGSSLAMERLAPAVAAASGVSDDAARVWVALAALLVASPFAVGVVRTSRALGALLAGAAVPEVTEGRPDLGAAPRRALVVALQLSLLLVVGTPLVALTQPFLPLGAGAAALALTLSALGFLFWRSAANLEDHVRAGAEMLIRALARQGIERRHHTLARVRSQLPGLGDLTLVELASSSAASGRTLADLNLRGQTGASVLAIVRGERGVAIPTGREELRAGDVLALAGADDAVDKARALLLRGELPPPDEVTTAG